jgi:hypothetical protein
MESRSLYVPLDNGYGDFIPNGVVDSSRRYKPVEILDIGNYTEVSHAASR